MDFSGGSVVDSELPLQGAPVQSLVGEDPACSPWHADPKIKRLSLVIRVGPVQSQGS